jgi:hypothetical protein
MNKLKELDYFVSSLELSTNKKEKNLSFAEAWKKLDDTVFEELTENLIEKR